MAMVVVVVVVVVVVRGIVAGNINFINVVMTKFFTDDAGNSGTG